MKTIKFIPYDQQTAKKMFTNGYYAAYDGNNLLGSADTKQRAKSYFKVP